MVVGWPQGDLPLRKRVRWYLLSADNEQGLLPGQACVHLSQALLQSQHLWTHLGHMATVHNSWSHSLLSQAMMFSGKLCLKVQPDCALQCITQGWTPSNSQLHYWRHSSETWNRSNRGAEVCVCCEGAELRAQFQALDKTQSLPVFCGCDDHLAVRGVGCPWKSLWRWQNGVATSETHPSRSSLLDLHTQQPLRYIFY